MEAAGACGVRGFGVGFVNGRLTEAPEGATWRLHECGAAGRTAAEVGACAEPDAPPSRRGWIVVVDGVGGD